jgi:hypothetical protein
MTPQERDSRIAQWRPLDDRWAHSKDEQEHQMPLAWFAITDMPATPPHIPQATGKLLKGVAPPSSEEDW